MRSTAAVSLMLALALCLCGCRGNDPVSGRLEPGTPCLTVTYAPLAPESTLPGGTRVQVEHDPGVNTDTLLAEIHRAAAQAGGSDPGPDPGAVRLVKVLVLDGPDAGQVVPVLRCSLRPLTESSLR